MRSLPSPQVSLWEVAMTKRFRRYGRVLVLLACALHAVGSLAVAGAIGPGDALIRLEDLPEGYTSYRRPEPPVVMPALPIPTVSMAPVQFAGEPFCGGGIRPGDLGVAVTFFRHPGQTLL